MFEFLKRRKIRDRAALRQTLLDRGHAEIPHHDSDAFDAILSTIVTQEILSTELSSHFEPDVDTSSDTDSGFEGDGGISGGGGADGDW